MKKFQNLIENRIKHKNNLLQADINRVYPMSLMKSKKQSIDQDHTTSKIDPSANATTQNQGQKAENSVVESEQFEYVGSDSNHRHQRRQVNDTQYEKFMPQSQLWFINQGQPQLKSQKSQKETRTASQSPNARTLLPHVKNAAKENPYSLN